MHDADPIIPLTAEQPWRGHEPYTEADRAFFHGRRQETDELRHLIDRDALTVLIGPQGVGKTSLVQAGLLASLAPDWLPVLATIDWTHTAKTATQQTFEAIEAAAKHRGLDGPRLSTSDSLWEALHRTGARWWSARNHVVTPLLVFDRFEDAFAAAEANATTRRQRDQFFDELSQLIANRPPARVASRLEDGAEAVDAFDFAPVPIRVLLVVREDAVPNLFELRALFPTLTRSKLRLGPFTEAQARDVLVRAAAQRGLFAEGVVDRLLPHLSGGAGNARTFHPATLSAQARALAEQRLQRGDAQITAAYFEPPPPAAEPEPDAGAQREPQSRPRRSRRRRAVPASVALLLAVAGAWLWHERERPSLSTELASTPRATPPPAALTAAKPEPRVTTAEAPAPATPAPAAPSPAPPAGTPTPTPAGVMSTPPPPAPPATPTPPEPATTTTIVPSLPPNPKPAPAAPAPARKPAETPRRDPTPASRPATTVIVAPPPAKPSPGRKPGFVPGGGG